MRDVTDAKGLGDLRTAITTRVHAKPPQKGTAHLDLYLLSKEKQRLERELARLVQRQSRIQEHLAETLKTIAKLKEEAQAEDLSQEPSNAPAAEERQSSPLPEYNRRRWKKMTLDY